MLNIKNEHIVAPGLVIISFFVAASVALLVEYGKNTYFAYKKRTTTSANQ